MGESRFIDFYEAFGLDRRMDEKELRRALGKCQTLVSKRESTTPRDDEKTLRELQEVRQQILQAMRILSDPVKRRQYDAELDEAIRNNTVERAVTQEIRDILEKARLFFRKGNFEMAARFAREAIDQGMNDAEPYELLGRSQFNMGDYDEALKTADEGARAFGTASSLRWLQVRLRVLMEDFHDAQRCLNEALDALPEDMQLRAEQVYLYFAADQPAAAEREMRAFMDANPTNMPYRKYVANNIIEIARRNYVYDSAADMLLIVEKSAYENCLRLIELANSIYQDEYTQHELAYIRQFGDIHDDKTHGDAEILYYVACVLCIGVALLGAGALFWALAGLSFLCGWLVHRLGRRPLWQLMRDEYRGFREKEDGLLYNILCLPSMFLEELRDLPIIGNIMRPLSDLFKGLLDR